METIQISEIKINERFRKTVGSLSSLVESIKEVGLLHPVVVSEKKELIAGWRRIKAFELLGRTEIPCSRVNLADLRKGEVHENRIRKDFTTSEDVAIQRFMEPEVEEAAKERQGTRTDLGKQLCAESARSRGIVASYVGKSHDTLRKEEAIVLAAEQNPEKFGSLLQKVDNKKTSVAHAYSIIKTAEKHAEPQPLPTGIFDVILADPPWEYYLQKRGSTLGHYEAQPTEDIRKLKIPSADNAVLFLWATNPKLEEALEVMKAWGFQYKTNLVWVKDKIGTGYYFRGQHELLFLGTKGNMGVPEEQNRPSSVLNAPRTEHSEKPLEVYKLIETMYPVGKRLELYARKKREGWESWGNELGA
jgi:N6-adenosine-specific RNA methylase IME4